MLMGNNCVQVRLLSADSWVTPVACWKNPDGNGCERKIKRSKLLILKKLLCDVEMTSVALKLSGKPGRLSASLSISQYKMRKGSFG